MASTPEVYPQQPAPAAYPPAGQPPMYPNAAEMPPGQPAPVAYAPAPAQPVAYAAPAPVAVAQPVPAVVQPLSLGASSVMCVCPACHATITTTTIYEAGGLCWLLCILLFLFGFCLGCCLIPFCINDCKDVVHKCPNCNALIGKYSRM